jgi:hypothetical protein
MFEDKNLLFILCLRKLDCISFKISIQDSKTISIITSIWVKTFLKHMIFLTKVFIDK